MFIFSVIVFLNVCKSQNQLTNSYIFYLLYILISLFIFHLFVFLFLQNQQKQNNTIVNATSSTPSSTTSSSTSSTSLSPSSSSPKNTTDIINCGMWRRKRTYSINPSQALGLQINIDPKGYIIVESCNAGTQCPNVEGYTLERIDGQPVGHSHVDVQEITSCIVNLMNNLKNKKMYNQKMISSKYRHQIQNDTNFTTNNKEKHQKIELLLRETIACQHFDVVFVDRRVDDALYKLLKKNVQLAKEKKDVKKGLNKKKKIAKEESNVLEIVLQLYTKMDAKTKQNQKMQKEEIRKEKIRKQKQLNNVHDDQCKQILEKEHLEGKGKNEISLHFLIEFICKVF